MVGHMLVGAALIVGWRGSCLVPQYSSHYTGFSYFLSLSPSSAEVLEFALEGSYFIHLLWLYNTDHSFFVRERLVEVRHVRQLFRQRRLERRFNLALQQLLGVDVAQPGMGQNLADAILGAQPLCRVFFK